MTGSEEGDATLGKVILYVLGRLRKSIMPNKGFSLKIYISFIEQKVFEIIIILVRHRG